MSAPSQKLPATLARVLDQVRQRDLTMKLAEFPLALIAVLVAAWSLQGLADRVFRFSLNARTVLLIADGVLVGWLVWRYVIRTILRRMDRRQAALFVERKIPTFRSSLISAVELSLAKSEILPQSQLLVKQLVADVIARLKKTNVVKRVIRPDGLKPLIKWMSLSVSAGLLLFICGWPTSGLLMKRILLAKDMLPTRTHVVAITKDLAVKDESDVQLAASATGTMPPDAKLVLMYEGKSPEVIQLLASSRKPGEFSQTIKSVRQPFRYRFEMNDGVGQEYRVAVAYPPVIKDLRFSQVFPAYTGLAEREMQPGSIKLLEGSTLRITGKSSKLLRLGNITINGAGDPQTKGFLAAGGGTDFKIELTVPIAGWQNLSVHLKATDGEESMNDTVYPVTIVKDLPPSVAIVSPRNDTIWVASSSVVPIACQAADDFGLGEVAVAYRIIRRTLDGQVDELGAGRIPFDLKSGSPTAKLQAEINLSKLTPTVSPGCSVIFRVEAIDTNPRFRNSETKESSIGRSAERTLVVVSEEQKRLELVEELNRRAASLDALYERQRELNESAK